MTYFHERGFDDVHARARPTDPSTASFRERQGGRSPIRSILTNSFGQREFFSQATSGIFGKPATNEGRGAFGDTRTSVVHTRHVIEIFNASGAIEAIERCGSVGGPPANP